jgi:choline kinase
MPHLTRSLSSFSLDKHSSDIFSLDSRGPPPPLSAQVHDGVQAPDDPAVTAEVQRLMQETRLWRIACSAHWVAWGIVQANVSGEAGSGSSSSADADADKAHGCPGEGSAVYGHEQHRHLDPASGTDPLTPFAQAEALDLRDRRPEAEGAAEGVGDAEAEAEGSEHEEFDYLAYAQERAMLFWGDVLQLGLVKEEELPGGLRGKVKVLKY